jgi:hypothetical protein
VVTIGDFSPYHESNHVSDGNFLIHLTVAQPSGIAYDSVVYPVEVSAMLYDAGGADATSEWTGATTITASCGVAQFTDLVECALSYTSEHSWPSHRKNCHGKMVHPCLNDAQTMR